MNKIIILQQINEFVNCANRDFPYEHLGVADKLILSTCVRKEVEDWEKTGEAHKIRSTNFIKGVLFRMRDFGYKQSPEVLDSDNNYIY